MYKFLFATSLLVLLISAACQTEKKCKYKPSPMFEANLPHIKAYNFEQQGNESLESIMLDRDVLVEINQQVCDQTRQEFRFTVPGNFTTTPDSAWTKEATRQLVYLSALSEKQAPLKAWADVIEQRRAEMRLGEDRELEPGIFVRIDRIVSPEKTTLVVLLSQQ